VLELDLGLVLGFIRLAICFRSNVLSSKCSRSETFHSSTNYFDDVNGNYNDDVSTNYNSPFDTNNNFFNSSHHYN